LIYREVQQVLDNAEVGLTPLGLARDSLALDINPNLVTGAASKGHFEQLYDRTVDTLENAAMAFEEARTMSKAIRSEGDSLEEVKSKIDDNERALTTSLIELYGTPYTDDIGPGKTYPQDYAGPDLVHYLYVDMPEYVFPEDTVRMGVSSASLFRACPTPGASTRRPISMALGRRTSPRSRRSPMPSSSRC